MSKYKEGDKVVLETTGINELGAYKFGNTMYSWLIAENFVDEYAKPLSEYTEKLEKKNQNKQKRIEKLVERLHRQADEITRLLKENEELKEKLHEEHYDFVWQSGYSQGVSDEEEKWKENVEIIRDKAFEAGQVKGQNDAWELAQKIGCYDCDGGFTEEQREEIFGQKLVPMVFHKHTYTKAAAKVAEWERQKEEICVGDVVRFKENHRVEFCVTDIYDDRFLYGINAEGEVYADRDIELFEKTGRHIDVDAWLAQIGGDCNGTD